MESMRVLTASQVEEEEEEEESKQAKDLPKRPNERYAGGFLPRLRLVPSGPDDTAQQPSAGAIVLPREETSERATRFIRASNGFDHFLGVERTLAGTDDCEIGGGNEDRNSKNQDSSKQEHLSSEVRIQISKKSSRI